jgi:hypothetical protein
MGLRESVGISSTGYSILAIPIFVLPQPHHAVTIFQMPFFRRLDVLKGPDDRNSFIFQSWPSLLDVSIYIRCCLKHVGFEFIIHVR